MTLLKQIDAGVEQGKVKAYLVRKAMSDSDINLRGLGYALLSEDHLRAILVEFKPKASDPEACFEYLLECIKLDLEWDEDYAHSREDALYELTGVVAPNWVDQGAGVKPADFWARVNDVMRGLEGGDVEVFLEGCPKDAGFTSAMKIWSGDPVLAQYVET
ncbi:hypothetical protein OAC63_04715 [Amylibacter sp.]|nr:hypothetical protein [Amylibacter sp.]